VAYRFEFVVECPTAEAIEELPEGGNWSPEAIRRLADWQFPPFALTIWLNQDLEIITNAARLELLAEPYSKQKAPDRGRDFNLNAERWGLIESHFARAAWAKQVTAARRTAEKLLRGSKEWSARIAERLNAAKRAASEREAQVASRLAFLSGKHRTEE